jgi:pimeloyl-ACP methyl ester carboxylesterase
MGSALMNRRFHPGPLLLAICLLLSGRAMAFESDYLSVKVDGNGPDLILIHGFACSPEVWSGLAKEIGSGFRLHFVTISGFAGSAAPKAGPESYLKTIRDEIARYIETERLNKPILIGHSMGGLVSLLVASHPGPKVSKVIVVDSLPFFSLIFNPFATTELVLPQAQAMEKQIAALDDESFARQAKSSASILTKSDEKKDLIVSWSKASDRKVYARYFRELMAYDARPELKTITCPVTVLQAYDEAMHIPEAQLKQLYATAYADLKTVSIKPVPGSFHFIMWDQPKGFNEAVKEALGSPSAA